MKSTMAHLLVNFAVFLLVCCFWVVSLVCCFWVVSGDGVGNDNPAYLPDFISINCGSGGSYTADDSREWIGDADTKFTSLLQIEGSSTTFRGADPVPYTTARTSRSRFSYMFNLKPGQKLIRLHFNPIPYYKRFQDLFSVEAGNFILLSCFSASITANALGTKSVVKEFCLNLDENKKLEIVFSAETVRAKQTYAFINGIEIESVPLHLSNFDDGIKVVGENSLAYVDNTMAQEIVHRVQIKRDSADGDSVNTFSTQAAGGQMDGKGINQMTWNVSVDLGFSYLVRFHFCQEGLRSMNFTLLINEMIAASTDSVFKESGYSGTPLYVDRMVIIKGPKQQGKRDLLFSLLSNALSMDEYVPIKGFEIFKLSNPYNSLASHNPLPQLRHQPSRAWHGLFSAFWKGNGTTAATVTMSLINIIICCLAFFSRGESMEERKRATMSSRPCRQFSLAEIRVATRDFTPEFIIGKGVFSEVYKGVIDNGQVTIAIKRLKHNCTQGGQEFWTEIKTLSELQHINLVSLIGYCCEQHELILVYEYMAGGTLADRLNKFDMDNGNCLSWERRLRICIDVAAALDYLHTDYGVIHCDIRASNILLDENSVAKISNFGMVKLQFSSDQRHSHVSTIVKGTTGYLDPNYVSTGKLTKKSDVYAFGVVLLEVLYGRPALDIRADEEWYNMTTWAQEVMLNMMVDSNLREEITPKSLKVFTVIVQRCLNKEPSRRPTMAYVVVMLKLALELQRINCSLLPKEISSVALDTHPSNNIKALTFADQQPRVYPTSKLSHQKHGKLSEHGDNPWQLYKYFEAATCKFSEDGNKPWRLLYQDLEAATRNFSVEYILASGNLGVAYRGILHDGREIAVTRSGTYHWMNKLSSTELDFLCQIPPHKNLCRLVGFCEKGNETLLVNEYMANGSLFDHLHSSGNVTKNSSVINSWKIRIKISLGAAQGLKYLHRDLVRPIIHRDLKSSNILLDEDWTARLSSFGLSFMHPDDGLSTILPLGAPSSMDPECLAVGRLTERSDVYSFGVVLLELLTGKRDKFQGHQGESSNLRRYALPLIMTGNLCSILDPRVAPPEPNQTRALEILADTAMRCTYLNNSMRPSMTEVVLDLIEALAVCEGAKTAAMTWV